MASHTADRTSWHNLPVHARQRIIDIVSQTDGSLAPYATVSREWQPVVERRNFSYIKLTMPRIEEFDLMTTRTQDYVQYIWLCLELQESAPSEGDSGRPVMSDADGHAVGTAFSKVLHTLSPWTPRASLVLDISVHSRSDATGWFQHLTFEPDDLCNERESDIMYSRLPMPTFPVTAANNPPLTTLALEKLFHQIEVKGPFREEDGWWTGLPIAPAVTTVLLRQQTRRRWKPKTMQHLLSRFPNLREVHWEPWREWDTSMQETIDYSK
jgi:hypothetical protein